ncbi:hypothetical protein, partial [Aliikangiella maris]
MIKTFKIKTLTAVVGASLAAMSLGVSASEQITVQKFANSGVVNYVAGNLGTTTQKNAVDSLKNILASQDAYHVSGSEDFTVRRQWIDELGKAHTHFTQTINGLTVYGTSMILHADVTENSLTSTSGQVYALTGSLAVDNNAATNQAFISANDNGEQAKTAALSIGDVKGEPELAYIFL